MLRLIGLGIVFAACGATPLVGVSPDDMLPGEDARAIAPVDGVLVTRSMAPEKRGPPYPVVLAHGFFGFEDFAGVNQLTYFYGVKDALAAAGEQGVYTPAVDPFNGSQLRGPQLLAKVEQVLVETNAAKVILIGHSQGGLDARWVAHARPELIAAVVTVGTPHHGSALGDVGTGVISDAAARAAIDALLNLIGGNLWAESRKESSLFAALGQFSKGGVAEFDAQVTDGPGVPYFSIAGRSGLRNGRGECDAPGRPAFISKWDSTLDPTNPLLKPSETFLLASLFEPKTNDGLVTVESAKWGRFLGCVPADHLDEIGQIFGAGPGLFNDWDHRGFYVELVQWLRAQGY